MTLRQIRNRVVSQIAVFVGSRSRRAVREVSPLDEGRVAVLSPASHGSLGDEALMAGSIACGQTHDLNVSVLTEGDHTQWPFSSPVHSMDSSSRLAKFRWDETWLRSQPSPERLVVIGADSVDGVYGLRSLSQRVDLLNQQVARGGLAYLANFSIRDRPSRDALRILRTLSPNVTLEARDRYSQRRAQGFLDREVSSAPDVAQYLSPLHTPTTEKLAALTSRWRNQGIVPISIVPNAHFGALYGDGEKLVDQFVALIQALESKGFGCVLLAHDLREDPGDPTLVREIVSRFPEGRSTALFIPRSAGEAKAAISTTDLCMTARMHAAVAALSQDIATVGLDYVDKFQGQFEWYGELSNVIPRETLLTPEAILEAVQVAIAQPARHTASTVRKTTPIWAQTNSHAQS